MEELYTIIDLHGTPLIVSTFGQWFGQPDQNFSQTALRTYEWWIYEIWPLSVGQNSSFFVFWGFFGGGGFLAPTLLFIKLQQKKMWRKRSPHNSAA